MAKPMTPKDELGMLALLLGLALALYAVTWLIAGPPRAALDSVASAMLLS